MLGSFVQSALQSAIAQFLIDRCDIDRQTITTDDYGSRADSWQPVALAVPCRVITTMARPSEPLERDMREQLEESYKLIVPVTIALDVDQRVTHRGITYAITTLETALSNELFHAAMMIRRR